MRNHLVTAAVMVGALLLVGTSLAGVQTSQDAVQIVPPARPAPSEPAAAGSAPLTFEVASVKPNRSGGGPIQIGIQGGGRLTATNVTVAELLRLAYQIQPFQIVGGPAWIRSDRFDIQARASVDFTPGPPPPPNGPPGPVQQMMQGLLADRFSLAVHRETREMPTYDLVLAQRDGRPSEKLKSSTLNCAGQLGARGRGAPAPNNAAGVPGCGMRIGPGSLSGNGVGMPLLANTLSQVVQRIVIDKTGLTGNYEFELTFTPERQGAGAPPGIPELPPVDPNGPSVFTAVQEQLGLKLESSRGPVSVLVVDKLERPTPD